MSPLSSRSPTFLRTAARWIETQGEVLVLVRYACAAGNRAWLFFAFGPMPPWLEERDDVLAAYVPSPDGELLVGVY